MKISGVKKGILGNMHYEFSGRIQERFVIGMRKILEKFLSEILGFLG